MTMKTKELSLISTISLVVFLSILLHWGSIVTADQEHEDQRLNFTPLFTQLTSHKVLPLIGVHIKNSRNKAVDQLPPNSNQNYQLFDIDRKSENEKVLVSTITNNYAGEDEIHIISKVWYTHLGYHRTKLSVKESIEDLPPNVKLHILLHYPRCEDVKSQMACKEEEDELPSYVKEAGPSPLIDRKIFLDSWRVLEELFIHHHEIASIGVSNFSASDWSLLLKNCRIIPHIHQGHAREYFEDLELMEILHRHGVIFQAYDVYEDVFAKVDEFDNLSVRLSEVAVDLNVKNISTLILAWFLQNRIGVVMTSDHMGDFDITSTHLAVRPMNHEQIQYLGDMIHFLLRGQDVDRDEENGKVVVTIINKAGKDVKLFWVDGRNEIEGRSNIVPGEERVFTTHPGHRFVIKDNDLVELQAFGVEVVRGARQNIIVE